MQLLKHIEVSKMFEKILNLNPTKQTSLQIECINQLEKIFVKENIRKINVNDYSFIGVRGKYLNKENYCINFKFEYKEFIF